MTVPRPRRYPRRPIVKAVSWIPSPPIPYSREDAEDFGLRWPIPWTTNLAPTSPPLPPERRSKLGNGPEGTETAAEQNNGVYRIASEGDTFMSAGNVVTWKQGSRRLVADTTRKRGRPPRSDKRQILNHYEAWGIHATMDDFGLAERTVRRYVADARHALEAE